ncbi:MAG: TIGR03986 family CRISPR-associated RAMP protein [Melioribacteraceae bacterium]|nr:TIGR03986 family CRISPR-associated RAMP protein [Melioribacteraceae bacterium]
MGQKEKIDFSNIHAALGIEKPDEDINQRKNTPEFNAKEKDSNHSIDIPKDYVARAPYNFVPINDDVVPAQEMPEFLTYTNEQKGIKRFTGEIGLKIETKTPIYIRDTVDSEQIEKKTESKDIPEFFSPGGKERIPGSSLRGMTRNLVEIMSYSKFEFFEEDKKFLYRAMADKSLDLRDNYTNKILTQENSGYTQITQGGYLTKEGNEYYIIPAKEFLSGNFHYRIEEKDAINSGIISLYMKLPVLDRNGNEIIRNGRKKYEKNINYKPSSHKIYFEPKIPIVHRNHTKPLYYAKIEKISDTYFNNSKEGYLVCTGWIPGGSQGKHLHWIVPEADTSAKKLSFAANVIENYINDTNREEGTDLLKILKDSLEKYIPCFYTEEGGEVTGFGYTGIFRIAYNNSLKNFIPKDNIEYSGVDIIHAIFGDKDKFAGRVFFEDAFLTKLVKQHEASHPQILASPKPTTFQHYLVQKGITPKFNNRGDFSGWYGLKDYNSEDITIRGNKLYWHRIGNEWIANASDVTKHPKQYTLIKPIEGEFNSKIRFENLSEVELGALLTSLDLPENCAHKIGMGKPLGLGSIRITPILKLSDRTDRYKKIEAELNGLKEDNIEKYKTVFAQYIINKLNNTTSAESNSSLNEFMNMGRMKELFTMLVFNGNPVNAKTRYMEIEHRTPEGKVNEYSTRPVLPLPTKV